MSRLQVNQSQLAGEFNLFQCLPVELQLTIYEAALDNLAKPRIVLLDIETVPIYSAARSRDLAVGWQLRVDNHSELHKESPLEMARSLLRASKTSNHVAERFLNKYQVWDGPRHCREFFSKDISMSFDVFWLPDNLLTFDWIKSAHPAGQDDWRDEERIACLMVSLEALEQVTRWAMGYFDDRDLQAVENDQVNLGFLSTTLGSILACYPSCEEIIVVVGAPSGDREHLSWNDLDYVHPDDEQVSKLGSYAADQDEADRCQKLARTYCDLYENDMQSAPELSFAFKRSRKPCVLAAPVPQVVVPAGSGSSKRSRDEDDEDDDAAVAEMPAKKRQRIDH